MKCFNDYTAAATLFSLVMQAPGAIALVWTFQLFCFLFYKLSALMPMPLLLPYNQYSNNNYYDKMSYSEVPW